MAFKKGQSGNPGGVSKEIEACRALARAACPDILARLIAMVKDPLTPQKEMIAASNILLDRGMGKAIQGVELTGAEGKDLAINLVIAQKEVK